MSWQERIARQSADGKALRGSFRGVPFIVPRGEGTVGRRGELHEYPKRDKPYVEDMGRHTREFSVDVFVDSSLSTDGDYLPAMNALMAALEEEGAGTLVHPWFGTMRVSLTQPARWQVSSKDGGRCSFSITFTEDGELVFPSSVTSTATVVQVAADNAIASSVDDFASTFSVDNQPSYFVTAIADELYKVLGAMEQTVGDVAGAIAAEIRAPYNMATAIVGAINNVATLATEPLRALQLYQGMFDAGADSASIPTTTANRKQQARNTAALHSLVQRSAIIEVARTASVATFATRNDALTIRDTLAAALDAQMEVVDPVSGMPIDDANYQALQDLRTAMVNDLRTRGARLPELVTYTPGAILPALVLAYSLYGDATRDEEIVARNKISHSGFVPGGDELEVLNV